MAYRTLLVPLFDDRGLGSVLEAALAVADERAHVIGLDVLPSPGAWSDHDEAMAATYGGRWMRHRVDVARRVQSAFEARIAAAGRTARWCAIERPHDPLERCIVALGNATDLLVLGLRGEAPRRSSNAALVPTVLFGSARPVLLVPQGRKGGAIGRRVLVGWDGSAAATRALWGALPLLARAEAVRVHGVSTLGHDADTCAPGSATELGAALARHGVPLELSSSSARAAEVAEALLGVAEDWRADAMVVGAWGRGPVRALALGDTTRQLLERTRLPVLACH